MKGGQGIPYWVQRWAGLRLVLGWTSLKLNVVAKHYDCSVQVVSCCAASVSAGEMFIDKLIDKAHSLALFNVVNHQFREQLTNEYSLSNGPSGVHTTPLYVVISSELTDLTQFDLTGFLENAVSCFWH